jgi:hypothetical protein
MNIDWSDVTQERKKWSAVVNAVMNIDWSDVTQERKKWSAVVNAVMNIRLAKNAGIFLTV